MPLLAIYGNQPMAKIANKTLAVYPFPHSRACDIIQPRAVLLAALFVARASGAGTTGGFRDGPEHGCRTQASPDAQRSAQKFRIASSAVKVGDLMGRNPFVIGLTGNIATGKSTVLHYLAAKGAHVIDADQLTHQAMAPDGPAYAAIVTTFGDEIVRPDGTIDRPGLGRVVFSHPPALARLEAIVHPAVFTLAKAQVESTTAPVVVIEAIKLLEARSLLRLCDETWVVTASEATQLRRLREERGMDEAEARRRMAAQSPQAEKVQQADRVINNDGTPAELYAQLDAIWAELTTKLGSSLSERM
jgi:dephospho-CoA kinase